METDAKKQRRLKTGTTILAIAALGLFFVTVAIFEEDPHPKTNTGRLLIAGGLANFALSLLWALIALFPLRRGEKWAFWAFCLPVLLYGIPMLVFDAMYVEKSELVSTLIPQLMGLILTVTGLFLVAPGVFRKPVTTTG